MIRFALIFIVSLAVSSQAAAVNWNNSKSKSNGAAENISIPQYFFANSINQNCLMEGKLSILVLDTYTPPVAHAPGHYHSVLLESFITHFF